MYIVQYPITLLGVTERTGELEVLDSPHCVTSTEVNSCIGAVHEVSKSRYFGPILTPSPGLVLVCSDAQNVQ